MHDYKLSHQHAPDHRIQKVNLQSQEINLDKKTQLLQEIIKQLSIRVDFIPVGQIMKAYLVIFVFTAIAAGVTSGALVPFRRLNNPTIGNHFYTTDVTEKTMFIASSYIDEGIECLIFTAQEKGTVPFYRDFNIDLNDHMYTTQNKVLSGYMREKIAGYCYPDPNPGTVPLYSLFSSGISDHLYTTDATEIGQKGYQYKGVACYVISS